MKSYFRFLGRNKLYTAIELVGLSISLAFVILTSSYLIDDMSYDRDIRDKGEIYVCHNVGRASSYGFLSASFDKHPEILDYCQFREAADVKLQASGSDFTTNIIVAGGNFFEFLPYRLAAGRADMVLKEPNSAVVSESFARRVFQGENPLGQVINHDSVAFTVQGVFKDIRKSIILNSDIVVRMDYEKPEPGTYFEFANLLRIKDNTDLVQLARSVYDGCEEFLFKFRLVDELNFTCLSDIDLNIGKGAPFHNLKDKKLQGTFIAFCTVLLLFSVLNYIFLTIAFSRFRLKEMATRMLLGTTRGGIVKRIISESITCTTIAFLAGVLIATSLQDAASELLRSRIEVFGSTGEFFWGASIILLTSILSGIMPALSSSFINPVDTIKGAGRKTDKVILGRVFIGIQCCICIIIISIASAMYLQTRMMINSPLGYKTENLLILSECKDKDIKNILQGVPSVRNISSMVTSPAQSCSGRTEMLFGQERLTVSHFICDTSALSILGIDMIRDFNSSSKKVLVYITESLYNKAVRLYESQGLDPEHITRQCSGVVTDFRFGNITSPDDGNNAVFIMPSNYRFLIETQGPDKDAYESITRTLREASIENFKLESFRDQIEESYRNEKNTIILISTFAALCILLTIMAIVAISSYYIQLKKHDTAVMKVFGIPHWMLVRKTVWGFILPVLVAVPAAVPAAYLHIGGWLENYAVRIDNSPAIYLAAAAFVFLVVSTSVFLGTLRLMKTNPAEALKKE